MTQEELKRLAKISGHEHVTAWLGETAWKDELFAHFVSSLLAPWTAVPVGQEVVLVWTEKTTPTLGRPYYEPYWYCEDEGTVMDFEAATRFQSPLHAAEALHQNTEKA